MIYQSAIIGQLSEFFSTEMSTRTDGRNAYLRSFGKFTQLSLHKKFKEVVFIDLRVYNRVCAKGTCVYCHVYLSERY